LHSRCSANASQSMSTNLHPMLNVAIKAARAAGAIINRAALDVESVRVAQKQVNDFVTEVDKAAEQAIIETLLGAYPGHGILAEESGNEFGAKNSDYVWIIDPLDGTTNFIHGFPVYCVSIALSFKGKVEHAVVYETEGVRCPGAGALGLAYVAAGFADGFFESGLQIWDVAAGSLLVTEAGGLVGNFTGEADFLEQKECLAGNPRIYGALVGIVGKYSKFASAGEKAGVRQALADSGEAAPAADVEAAESEQQPEA